MANTRTPTISTYQQERVPFYGELENRDSISPFKDLLFENTFCEGRVNQVTGSKEAFVRKRPGMAYILAQDELELRGSISYEGRMFYVHGINVVELVADTRVVRFTLNTASGKVGMAILPYQGDDQLYLVVTDGVTIFFYNLNTNTWMGELASGYPVPHLPALLVIDGYLIMAKAGTGDIYNSQTENLALWDFIEAELYPDNIQMISRYNNYIAAMGTSSVEFFYDAGIEDGSPFARNDSFVCPIGCAAPYAVVQTDQRLIWVGQTHEGGRSIWMMTDTKPVEISNSFIKEQLDTEGTALTNAVAYTMRVAGHHFYILCLTNHTYVFDLRDKLWTRWTSNIPFGFPRYLTDNDTGIPYLIGTTRVVRFNPNTYLDIDETIPVYWQTSMLDFGSMNRKVANRLTLIGDIPTGDSTLGISWSDNDYQTFTPVRNMDLKSFRPAIVNMGYFRRRAYRFTFTGNSPLRLYGMELTYNVGTN